MHSAPLITDRDKVDRVADGNAERVLHVKLPVRLISATQGRREFHIHSHLPYPSFDAVPHLWGVPFK